MSKIVRDITEKDWKHFRKLHELAINRFSKETLANIHQIMSSKEVESKHEKYLQICQYIKERDKILRDCFDGIRRSIAKLQILQIYNLGLIKSEELNQFSDDVKDFVRKCNEL
ncbi:MAG: hypothetical protein K1X72_24605 [Pyrinomonadaceae bacterium]|nr:hypothetical protein [Pyrinomonadaceae bacterium]